MTTNVGAKTQQLVRLQEAGCAVPRFCAIPVEQMTDSAEAIAQTVQQQLSVDRYAVRSSAFCEDTQASSRAGRFLTRLDVSPAGLAQAITDVREDARAQLGSLEEFSLLVMEFIEPDRSGVIFTRHPTGGREMVLEWVNGRGDALVSGLVTPERHVRYWKQGGGYPWPGAQALCVQAQHIEALFGFPQDIEWVMRGKECLIVQSRPITTLTQEAVDLNQLLEDTLPSGPFLWEKTEVCEVAPRPSDATMEVLRGLYAQGGPVQSAYATQGVRYTDTAFLVRVGGELFVDREKELKSLLPSYSLFSNSARTPAPVSLSGMLRSWRNQQRLAAWQVDLPSLYAQVRDRLVSPGANLEADYTLIFLINIAAAHAVQQVRAVLPASLSLSAALSARCHVSELEQLSPPAGLVGNSLDLEDRSVFVTAHTEAITDLPIGAPEAQIAHAQAAMRLREYARWLMLVHLTPMRQARELVVSFIVPRILSDRPPEQSGTTLGVSTGKATGVLVRRSEVKTIPGAKILFVEALTPDLVPELTSEIVGVLSVVGGVLSHVAIIAREMRLPVVVHVDPATLVFGTTHTINGETGEVG